MVGSRWPRSSLTLHLHGARTQRLALPLHLFPVVRLFLLVFLVFLLMEDPGAECVEAFEVIALLDLRVEPFPDISDVECYRDRD